MATYDATITSKTGGGTFSLNFDVNEDGKNYANQENRFHNESASQILPAFVSALTATGVPFTNKPQGADLQIKFKGLTRIQFLAIEAACNSVWALLNAREVAKAT